MKNYLPQIIEGSTVNSANVKVDAARKKQEREYPCDECGELFFYKSSIATHKINAHSKRIDDNTSENDETKEKSPVSDEKTKTKDDERLQKGRNILNQMIHKPGSKKKPKITPRKRKSPCKTAKDMKKTTLWHSAQIANSSQETNDNDTTVNLDETKSAFEVDKSLPEINPPRRITRSISAGDSKDMKTDGNETTPSPHKSEVKTVQNETRCKTRSQSSEDSAEKNDTSHHPSPGSVLRKI